MKEKLKDTLRKPWIWLLLVFLLSWGTNGLNAFVVNPEKRKELERWIAKVVTLEKRLSEVSGMLFKVSSDKRQDSLSFSADIVSLKRQKFALENQPVKLAKGEIKHVKEPLTASDSARIADIIYEKKPRETMSYYDSLRIYHAVKEKIGEGKIYSIPNVEGNEPVHN
jgi:hypothetical protein